MTKRRNLQVLVCVCLAMACGHPAAAKDPPVRLTPADSQFLGRLFKKGIPDPRGAKFVQFKMNRWTVWGETEPTKAVGWLVPAKDKRPARLVLPWGGTLPAPKEYQAIDFVGWARTLAKRDFDRQQDGSSRKPANGDDGFRREFERMRRMANPSYPPPILPCAAWLHRLGQDKLSAEFLVAAGGGAGKNDGVLARMAEEIAWPAYGSAVHAYMHRADHEASAHIQQLFNFCASRAKHFASAHRMLAELKRRRGDGTFAKAPGPLPKDLASWPVAKRIAYLIKSLAEVDTRQYSQPGDVHMGSNERVFALISIGDQAVPALIDCIEKDTRLTRCVHYWRDFYPSRTILGVREAALVAAMSILRTRFFDPRTTSDNFTLRGKSGAKAMAARLRRYCKTYGKLPFPDRMMKILTDAATKPEALREAADNIGRLGTFDPFGHIVDTSGATMSSTRIVVGANPAVAKFSDPTAAEAILAAMDRDLKTYDTGANHRDQSFGRTRDSIEDRYISALVGLGDKRIAATLQERCRATKTVRMRRKWALACFRLGQSAPINELAAAVKAGRLKLPPTDTISEHKRTELYGIVECLVTAGTPATDEALYALADPKHPYYERVALITRWAEPDNWFEPAKWFRHLFCLKVLRAELNRKEPTGITYRIEAGRLKEIEGDDWDSWEIPAPLANAGKRKAEARERRADAAAIKLGEFVYGLPWYHPLLMDADQRLVSMRKLLDRHRFALMTVQELRALDLDGFQNTYFRPNLGLLQRPATPADVREGRAIFHQGGRGKLGDMKLPATAVLKRDWPKKEEQDGLFEGPPVPRVLIVQAERTPKGKVLLGIIGHNEIRTVSPEQLRDIEPIKNEDGGR